MEVAAVHVEVVAGVEFVLVEIKMTVEEPVVAELLAEASKDRGAVEEAGVEVVVAVEGE